jgi:hypothetical protein
MEDGEGVAVGRLRRRRKSVAEVRARLRGRLALSSRCNKNKPTYHPGLGDNVKIDDNGTAVKVGDLGKSVFRPNLKYPITDPEAGAYGRFRNEAMT